MREKWGKAVNRTRLRIPRENPPRLRRLDNLVGREGVLLMIDHALVIHEEPLHPCAAKTEWCARLSRRQDAFHEGYTNH